MRPVTQHTQDTRDNIKDAASTKKTDSYYKTKVACFFNPVVATKKTEKVVERITCDDKGGH